MSSCIDKDSQAFKNLKKMTGVDDDSLSITMMVAEDMKGRLPEIDEVPNADSFPVLESNLSLKPMGDRFITDTRKIAVDSDLQGAVVRINNIHKDLEAKVFDFDGKAIVDVVKRPNIGTFYEDGFDVETNDNPSKRGLIFESIADKSSELYGVKMNVFSEGTIDQFPELQGIYTGNKNAFILNNEIYINTDNASLDAPIHEMMHMLMGEMKYNDAELYNSLVESMAELPGFNEMHRRIYPDLTQRDAMEEVFVTQVARSMVGMDNVIDKLPLGVRSKIEYNVLRMIDTSIMGSNSALGMEFHDLSKYSINDLCRMLGSTIINNKAKINGDHGFAHRIALNVKREMIKNNELKEIC